MFLATSAQIKALDALASEKYGILEIQLMENAGKSIFEAIKKEFQCRVFAVFCGKGNNGGDGFVVARLLKQEGFQVAVYLTHAETELSGTAKIAFDRMRAEDVPVRSVTDDVDKNAVILDALLGISISGAPRGIIKTAIDRIEAMNQTVISVDIPSGLSADDGSAPGSVVKADYTYALALDKIGLNTEVGKSLCGKKQVLDIGIPTAAVEEVFGKTAKR